MDDWGELIVPVILLVAFLFVMNFQSRLEDRRVNRRLQFAKSLGLSFVGAGVPSEFPAAFLEALPLQSERRDGIIGWHHGELVAAFEFERSIGRGSNWNSVVALRQHHPRAYRGKVPFGCSAASYGEWAIIYSNTLAGRRLSTNKIAELWSGMRTTSNEEAVELQQRHAVASNLVIRPHGTGLNL